MHENITVTDMKCLVPIFEDEMCEGKTQQILGRNTVCFQQRRIESSFCLSWTTPQSFQGDSRNRFPNSITQQFACGCEEQRRLLGRTESVTRHIDIALDIAIESPGVVYRRRAWNISRRCNLDVRNGEELTSWTAGTIASWCPKKEQRISLFSRAI